MTRVGDVLAQWSGRPAPTRADWQALLDQDVGPASNAGTTTAVSGLPAPYPSERFVPRPAVEERVVELLTAPPSGSRGSLVALIGMSGSGKTMSAQVVAADPQVRTRYPDGVLWLDLRRTPMEAAAQAAVLRALGEPAADQAGDLRSLLQERLAHARILIVLDNLRSLAQLQALDVLGPGGALLVTTTERDALPHGTELCPVQHFGDAGAAEVLRRYADAPPGPLPPAADAVRARCAGLPLALAICGALVADGYGWDELDELLGSVPLSALEKAFRDYPHVSLLAAFEVSTSTLDETERAGYDALAVFAGRGAVPVSVASRWWSLLGLDLDPRRTIRRLAGRSLLTHHVKDGTFLLHDLLYQYVSVRVGSALTGLHERLARSYLTDWGELSAGLPSVDVADHYGVAHVGLHLAQGGRADLLHRLLAVETPPDQGPVRSRWFDLHDTTGSIAEYLADVDRAHRCAEQAADRATDAADLARYRALEMHYTLIRSSLLGIAANVPVPLMVALVRRRIWSFSTAWTYGGLLHAPLERARVFSALVRLSTPDTVDRSRLLIQARVAAAAIGTAKERVWALASLVPAVPERERAELARTAIALAEQEAPTELVWVLSRLAGHVPELVRDRLLAVLDEPGAWRHADDLVIAARRLPELRPSVRALARNRRWPWQRLLTLTGLLVDAAAPERAELLTDIATAVDEPDNDYRAVWSTLLRVRTNSPAKYQRLTALFAALPEAARPATVELAAEVTLDAEPASIAFALTVLPEERRQRLRTALAAGDTSVPKLCELAPYLSPDRLAGLVDQAAELPTATGRGRALAALAPHLPPELLTRALGLLLELDHPKDRATAFTRLAPRLSAAQRLTALAMVTGIDEPDTRAMLLIDLAPYLPASALPSVPAAVPAEAGLARAMVLTQLALLAREPLRTTITAQAVDAVEQVPLRHTGLHGLTAGITDPRQLFAVFALRETLNSRHDPADAEVVVRHAVDLPPGTIAAIAPVASAMADSCDRAHALTVLARCETGPLRAELARDALIAACAPHHHGDGTSCRVESRFAPLLSTLPEADRLPLDPAWLDDILAEDRLETGPADEDRDHRRAACLAAYLPATHPRRPELVPAPLGPPDGPYDHDTESGQNAEVTPRRDWAEWRRTLADAALTGRPAVLETAVAACLALPEPSGSSVGEPTAVLLAQHIETVQRWWPGVTRTTPNAGVFDQLADIISTDSHTERESWLPGN
ncbi:NB-ARC domain-containing protein [Amycolatopsis sp. NPDC021455]|uniref:NB-ARC domain-containing protein n=1 Tax=Amycolatopsis sp. NPDC021455 TaxID=3154901 RepID=UPI0033C94F69